MKFKYLILFFFISCNSYDKSNLHKFYSVYNYEDGSINVNKFDSLWDKINEYPKKYIEYLISFRYDSTRIGLNGKRITLYYNGISYYHSYGYHHNNSICAAYLICAIYYNNYAFASDKILYNNEAIIYNQDKGRYYKYDISKDYIKNIKKSITSSKEEQELAWKLIIDWWKENKHKSIEEIRKGERPFGNSSLYWIGEEGGKVNKNFPHKFVPCYDKSEKP